jgi:hypothetical protein
MGIDIECYFAGNLGVGSSQLMFYSDDAIQEVCSGANRCRPRGPFSGLVSSFFTCWLPVGDASESKSWAKGRAAALLELSKRQQSALLDKQEAIDLLQWKLQQLQVSKHCCLLACKAVAMQEDWSLLAVEAFWALGFRS